MFLDSASITVTTTRFIITGEKGGRSGEGGREMGRVRPSETKCLETKHIFDMRATCNIVRKRENM